MKKTEKLKQENNQFNEEQIKKMLVQEFLDELKKLNKFQKITVRNFFYANKKEFLKISVESKNMVIYVKNEVIKKVNVNFDFDFEVKIPCEEIYNLVKKS